MNRRDLLAAALAAPFLRLQSRRAYDLVLRGATVFDGTGAPGRVRDVGIAAGRIAAVAATLRETGREEIDLRGLGLAPGFVDIHSHADGSLFRDPRLESVIRQGITTVVIGADGSSHVPARSGEAGFGPLFRRIAELRPAANVATMVGLGTVRGVVVGQANRPATPAELVRMTSLVRQALATGACGASSGLEYPPGAFATQEELIALCRPLAARRLPYATHLRDEEDQLLEAVDEAIAISRGARCPLQLSHLKTGGPRNWSKIGALLARVDAAKTAGLDLSFDRYPYVAWATGLASRFPLWAREGGTEAFLRRLRDPALDARIRADVLAGIELVGGWNTVLITDLSAAADQDAIGKRLVDWARAHGLGPYEAAVRLILNSNGRVGSVVFAMSEENLERLLAHRLCMVSSDGGAFAVEGPAREGHPHPRGLGTFPRVLGRYVRERGLLGLPEAIHKMTGMPASRLRLPDRGVIRAGAAADLVAFDPATVADRASFEAPFQYPAGIPLVVVNGAIACRDGERRGAGAGRVLRPAAVTRG